MELYLKIGSLMEKHGFTNQSLADASGVPVGTVSGIRSGKIRSPGYETVCAMLSAMGEQTSALAEQPCMQPLDAEPPDDYIDQRCKIASLSATLDAQSASAQRNADRYTRLEAELQDERRRNARLHNIMLVLLIFIVLLAAVYIWDVSNLHSGLTAYFNQ